MSIRFKTHTPCPYSTSAFALNWRFCRELCFRPHNHDHRIPQRFTGPTSPVVSSMLTDQPLPFVGVLAIHVTRPSMRRTVTSPRPPLMRAASAALAASAITSSLVMRVLGDGGPNSSQWSNLSIRDFLRYGCLFNCWCRISPITTQNVAEWFYLLTGIRQHRER